MMYPVPVRGPRTARQIAETTGGTVRGDFEREVDWLCTLKSPRPRHLAFATAVERLAGRAAEFEGMVLLVPLDCPDIAGASLVEVANPRIAFARAAGALFQAPPAPGIHASAIVDSSAQIAPEVVIGPNSVIARDVVIGEGSVIRSNVVIGPSVRIGKRCLIKSHAVIGEEGFGMEQDEDGHVVRIPHFGAVVIGNDVEIGCHCAIARGTIEDTVIGDRSKIDDLVFVAHNCIVGRDTMIIACAEISGSVTVGDAVWVGPNAAITNGVTICDRAFVGISACVTKSIVEPGVYAGVPAKLLRKI